MYGIVLTDNFQLQESNQQLPDVRKSIDPHKCYWSVLQYSYSGIPPDAKFKWRKNEKIKVHREAVLKDDKSDGEKKEARKERRKEEGKEAREKGR